MYIMSTLCHAVGQASYQINTYSKLCDGGPDSCISHVLFTKEVSVNAALAVPYHQKRPTHVTKLHLLVKVMCVQFKPSQHL